MFFHLVFIVFEDSCIEVFFFLGSAQTNREDPVLPECEYDAILITSNASSILERILLCFLASDK